MSKKFNSVMVEDLRKTLKESKNIETTDLMVVDFLNEYIDEDLVDETDLIKSDSMLDELFDYVKENAVV
jgi:hypothetical protein